MRRAMERPPVAILCGGRGTRLQERTREIPKPLVEIGGRPILWHVIRIYAAQGFRRFVLLTGYKGELVADFAEGEPWPHGVEVACVDTGSETPTGGRLRRAAAELGQGTACVTYADGVADVDLGALLAFHAAHGGQATMTVVRPALPFGVTDLDGGGRVTGFREKPRSEHWINGGFFCFEAAALRAIGQDAVLERGPLEDLAARGELYAYRHDGFWDCMDTYKDAVLLNDLWAAGQAPWRVWG
jgi:glucose-1-phosphate cytidylyltransferase